jgi:hypothetical protein
MGRRDKNDIGRAQLLAGRLLFLTSQLGTRVIPNETKRQRQQIQDAFDFH